MTTRAMRATTSLLLSAVLILTAAAAPALAAKKDKGNKKPPEPTAVIETLKGVKYRMANSKMAPRVTRIADVTVDQVTNDGEPAIDAPEHSDLVAVYVAPIKMPAKLLGKMASDFPRGVPGSFFGCDADWVMDDRAVFVAAEMAAKRPSGAGWQQLEVGLDGSRAQPVQVATLGDGLAGIERFSLSGIFSNGAWGTGSTDVSGREPGADIELYNTSSGVFGLYDPKQATYYLVMPSSKAVESVTVAVRTGTDAGEVIDRLELPGGGILADLSDPGAGFSKGAGVEALSCRALETFSAESGEVTLVDPGATLIRYTAGMDVSADAASAAQLLAAAADAVGPIPMLLTAVGSDAEPLAIDGELSMTPTMDVLTLIMEVPAGQWRFEPAEGAQLETPSGERLIDHGSLTGSAGVLTGPGLDGVVAGDPTCGRSDAELVSDEGTGAEAIPEASKAGE
jgi:hypothetical protein